MINGQDLGRLIELAFDYVSAESEQQAAQFRNEAARLATIETTTLINGQDLGRLIELAFDYVSAESGPQAAQFRDEAARLAPIETTTFRMWLDFVDHIKVWKGSNRHLYPMSWASALHFLSAKQTELEPVLIGPQEKITIDELTMSQVGGPAT